MIVFNVNSGPIRLLQAALVADLRRYQRAFFNKLKEAGRLLRREAQSKLRSGARGPSVMEGTLLRHHRIVIQRSRKFRVGVARIWDLKVGPTPRGKAFYGKFQELGVGQTRKTRRGASRGSLIADPWLEPTRREKESEVQSILGSALKELTGGLG